MTAPAMLVNGREAGRYRDRCGREHVVRIREARGGWEVVDCEASEITIVDLLAGPEESRATAHALAADWIAQQRAR